MKRLFFYNLASNFLSNDLQTQKVFTRNLKQKSLYKEAKDIFKILILKGIAVDLLCKLALDLVLLFRN